MRIQTRTKLCKLFTVFSSIINDRIPHYVEHTRSRNTHVSAYEMHSPVRGNFLLPYLTPTALAAYIEQRLLLPAESDQEVFPFPFMFWMESVNADASHLITYGYIPITTLPHIYYQNGSAYYDFSRLVFHGKDVVRFFRPELLQESAIQPSLADVIEKIDRQQASFDIMLQKQDELLTAILEGYPTLMEVAERINSLVIRSSDIEKVTTALLDTAKRSGKSDLKPVAKRAAEIFQQAFKDKERVERQEILEYVITRDNFLGRLKKDFPLVSERTFLLFWGMLAPEYKYDGRPEEK